MKIYIGWDPRDITAAEVCVKSLQKHASSPLDIEYLKEHELRKKGLYWREYRVTTGDDGGTQYHDMRDGRPFSTQFSFTRFLIPALENFDGEWACFMDPDFMWRADFNELFEECRRQAEEDPEKAIFCVKHDHRPPETSKMDGVKQSLYARKNWSSLYLCRPWKCRILSKYQVNKMAGGHLHGFLGFTDDEIGGVDEKWNWLEGWSSDDIDPAAVHFTRGTPDMIGACQYADEWWRYAKA